MAKQRRPWPIRIAENSYTLDLGSSLQWSLSATGEARPWLDRLASFWRLRPGTNGSGPTPTFRFDAAPEASKSTELLPAQGWKAMDLAWARIWSHLRVEDVVCELTLGRIFKQDFSMTSAAASAIYARALARGGLPAHGALIERNGVGVLLCGESGIGKSTCSRRVPDPWRALSDDHALVLPNDSHGFRAHPFPTWSDLLWRNRKKSWDVQARIPLAAIFFLQQADTDQVSAMGLGEASARLNRSANEALGFSVERLEKDDQRLSRGRIFQNACEVSRAVNAYALSVSPDGRFWEKIEEVVPELDAGSLATGPQT